MGKMFENPGTKIKKLAKVEFWVITAALVIGLLAFGMDELFEDVEGILLSAVILVVGVGAAYISALFLAAFGDLVESNRRLVELAEQKDC